MPKATIYIREEDWDKWQSIADKPAFIHTAINMNPLSVTDFGAVGDGKTDDAPAIQKTVNHVANMPDPLGRSGIFDKQIGKCGHTLDDRGKCLTKGCKGK